MPRIVLLADDSVTAQNMGRRILTDAGYEVITVNNGSAALKKIHESRPDLIVLDVYMPGYGGLEVCQRLKESEATMKIPVLLTVGKMEPFKTEEAKRVRADGHIIKPFDASELLAALTKLEDRIVPQSENGKAKSGKKAKASVATDPAAELDESRTEQISYLKREKNRQASTPTRKGAEAPVPAIPTEEEGSEDAVTFASGPIYQPHAHSDEAAKAAPEFPVEKAEQVPVAEAEVSAQGEQEAVSAEEAPVTEAVAAPQETAPGAEAASPREEQAPPPQTPRWVAENVALSAEEASRSLEEEMREANAAAEAAAEPPSEERVAETVEVRAEEAPADTSSPAEPEETSGAAFAAAASASDSSQPTEAISSAAAEPAARSESAPAWQEWERIRDSVVSQQTAEAIVQSVVASAQAGATAQEAVETQSGESETAKPAPSENSSTQPAQSGDALSSIVDNVLAELKPRLLAEIAKQLANDKK